MDAKQSTLTATDALALLRDVDELYAVKGKKVVHLNLKKAKPDEAALKSLVIGPTGNLRAPTLRVGRTLVVGFDEATYRVVFGAQT